MRYQTFSLMLQPNRSFLKLMITITRYCLQHIISAAFKTLLEYLEGEIEALLRGNEGRIRTDHFLVYSAWSMLNRLSTYSMHCSYRGAVAAVGLFSAALLPAHLLPGRAQELVDGTRLG